MVHLTVDGGMARVLMTDVASGNALGEPMVHALTRTFDTIDHNRDIRVVVLAGEGETFSSGAPRALLQRLTRGEVRPSDIQLPRLLLDCAVPVIAALSGHATGGGFALGLAADVLLLASDARYGFTFMNLGFTPGMGTTRLCEHALSPAVAHELLYTGELRRGRDLAGRGVNYVLPRADVLPRAMDIAARIAAKPRVAVETLKRTLSLPRRQAFEAALTMESLMHQITFGARDAAAHIEDEYVE